MSTELKDGLAVAERVDDKINEILDAAKTGENALVERLRVELNAIVTTGMVKASAHGYTAAQRHAELMSAKELH